MTTIPPPPPGSNGHPLRIPRKPLAIEKASTSNRPCPEPKTGAYVHWESAPPNGHSPTHVSAAPNDLSPRRRTSGPFAFLEPLRTKYLALRRRTKMLIAVALLCLLILIIGLAAGLATRSKTQNLPLPTAHGGPWTGELTYYDPGLGACGIESSDGENIVAVSHVLFDAVSVGTNPNANPLCGKMIRAKRPKGTVDLKVVDRCTGCQPRDLDITMKVFAKLAEVEAGRVSVEWSWLEGVPGEAS